MLEVAEVVEPKTAEETLSGHAVVDDSTSAEEEKASEIVAEPASSTRKSSTTSSDESGKDDDWEVVERGVDKAGLAEAEEEEVKKHGEFETLPDERKGEQEKVISREEKEEDSDAEDEDKQPPVVKDADAVQHVLSPQEAEKHKSGQESTTESSSDDFELTGGNEGVASAKTSEDATTKEDKASSATDSTSEDETTVIVTAKDVQDEDFDDDEQEVRAVSVEVEEHLTRTITSTERISRRIVIIDGVETVLEETHEPEETVVVETSAPPSMTVTTIREGGAADVAVEQTADVRYRTMTAADEYLIDNPEGQEPPEELLRGLPPELGELVKSKMREAIEKLEEEEERKSPKEEHETDVEKLVPTTAEDLNTEKLEELLQLVHTLPEEQAKLIYEQITSVIKKSEEDDAKEELIRLQMEQYRIPAPIPDELASAIPPQVAEAMQEKIREMLPMLMEQEEESQQQDKSADDSDMNEIEKLEEEQKKLMPQLPQELAEALPEELRQRLQHETEEAVMQLAREEALKEEQSTPNLKLRMPQRETEAESDKGLDDDEFESETLPPTPAVETPYVDERPRSPTPRHMQRIASAKRPLFEQDTEDGEQRNIPETLAKEFTHKVETISQVHEPEEEALIETKDITAPTTSTSSSSSRSSEHLAKEEAPSIPVEDQHKVTATRPPVSSSSSSSSDSEEEPTTEVKTTVTTTTEEYHTKEETPALKDQEKVTAAHELSSSSSSSSDSEEEKVIGVVQTKEDSGKEPLAKEDAPSMEEKEKNTSLPSSSSSSPSSNDSEEEQMAVIQATEDDTAKKHLTKEVLSMEDQDKSTAASSSSSSRDSEDDLTTEVKTPVTTTTEDHLAKEELSGLEGQEKVTAAPELSHHLRQAVIVRRRK